MENIINKKYTYALIGASNNEEKYGHKVLKNLLDAGFTVLPVNLGGGEILKQTVYRSIEEIEQKIDVVIFVVPPTVTEKLIKDVVQSNITKIWLQPGSENEKIIEFCEKNNIQCQHSACIMLEQLKYV